MDKPLYVAVAVDSDGQILRYGPTSESPGLLRRHEWRTPSATDRVLILRTVPGFLLRVSARVLAAALSE